MFLLRKPATASAFDSDGRLALVFGHRWRSGIDLFWLRSLCGPVLAATRNRPPLLS